MRVLALNGSKERYGIAHYAIKIVAEELLKENIIVDEATTIVGDLSARSLTLDGQMNGKIIAEDTCLIKEHAVLNGNIQTRRIGVSQGAVLNGEIKTLAENK